MVQKDVKVTLKCLFDYYVNAEVWSYQFEGNVYVFAHYMNKLFQSNEDNTYFCLFFAYRIRMSKKNMFARTRAKSFRVGKLLIELN